MEDGINKLDMIVIIIFMLEYIYIIEFYHQEIFYGPHVNTYKGKRNYYAINTTS